MDPGVCFVHLPIGVTLLGGGVASLGQCPPAACFFVLIGILTLVVVFKEIKRPSVSKQMAVLPDK